MPKVCDVCDGSPARFNRIFDKNLCQECRNDPEYKLIYKTTAKNKYFFTDKDIEQLECFETTGYNGYSFRCSLTLIRELEAINYFCAKHNISMDELDDMIEKLKTMKKTRSKKIKQTKQKNLETREKNLKKALKKVGLVMREDSKLCKGYIDGSIKDWTIEQIVERMCQMKFLYDYANMDHYIEKAKKSQGEELEAGYFPDMSIFDQAEMYALKKIGGYPNKWPWLKK